MARTVEQTVYSFNELSEQAKQRALELLYDINVDYGWWSFTYEDAKNVGISIKGSDLYTREIKIELYEDAYHVSNKIIKEHGSSTETYQIAYQYIKDYDNLVKKYSDGINTDIVREDNEYEFDKELEDLEHEFINEIGSEYLSILNNEYEYLTSNEAIIETIEANSYEFTESGGLY